MTQLEQAVDSLIHQGFIARDDSNQLCFPSPIVRFILINRMFLPIIREHGQLTLEVF